MSALDVFWHIAGFLAVPCLFGALAAGAVRLLWRRRWGARPFWRAALQCALVATGVAAGGWAFTGRDGSMLTYGAMVLACALLLVWPMRRT